MRTALVISLTALFLVGGASAQQEPPKLPPEAPPAPAKPAEGQPPATPPGATPPGATPPATPPAAGDPKAANPKPAETAPAADPMKMATPGAPGKKPPQSTVDDRAYILGPEDQISVFVYQGVEFTGQHMIRPDGKITINLVGDVQASGLTPEDLAKSIREKIKAYVNDPDVTVSVLAVRSKKYLINGEVYKPGEYLLVVPTRVFQALVNAGGFKDFANQKRITVIHENNERDYFNYKEVLAGKKLDQNIWVRPGDIIVVK
ncbi:MAG TPA: polysaccharide biosynthesis/export family protein [Candidatus Acidoferrum sp.]|nr:polysaccharide biosynthesis/export family protein [Candidatus Acidoferrum sp.]